MEHLIVINSIDALNITVSIAQVSLDTTEFKFKLQKATPMTMIVAKWQDCYQHNVKSKKLVLFLISGGMVSEGPPPINIFIDLLL